MKLIAIGFIAFLLLALGGCGQQSTSDCQYVEQQHGNFTIWDTHCDQYHRN